MHCVFFFLHRLFHGLFSGVTLYEGKILYYGWCTLWKLGLWGVGTLKILFDFFFPHLCPGCQKPLKTMGFCSACWPHIQWLSRRRMKFALPEGGVFSKKNIGLLSSSPDIKNCILCAEPLSLRPFPILNNNTTGPLQWQFSLQEGLCRSCRLHPGLFHSHQSLWHYGALSRRLIFSLKHGKQRVLAQWLAKWMLPLALEHHVHCIIPVPLHPKRLKKRGFNQCALIARALSKMTLIPVYCQNLKRIRQTASQGGLSPERRHDNLSYAFQGHPLPFFQPSVLLLDDVFTTGATLNACAGALIEAGAHRVHTLTIAKVTLGKGFV